MLTVRYSGHLQFSVMSEPVIVIPVATQVTRQRSLRQAGLMAAGLSLLMALTWLVDLDAAAQEYLQDALTNNLLIYATARTINAIISVIQSVEISISLGAGVAVHPGEALDPLNDLIERFSGFVLYGLAGLGLQQVVLTATSSLAAKILTSIAVVATCGAWLWRISLPAWLQRLLVLLIIVRFAFVVEVGLSWSLDRLYFEAQEKQALSSLDVARSRLQEVRNNYMQAMDDNGLFGGAWQTAKAIVGTDEEQGITDLAAGAIVQLIVIMLIKSVLLPLGFVWVLWRVLWWRG